MTIFLRVHISRTNKLYKYIHDKIIFKKSIFQSNLIISDVISNLQITLELKNKQSNANIEIEKVFDFVGGSGFASSSFLYHH